MADGNNLHILNNFPFGITITVAQDSWNCCDNPNPGQMIGFVEPGNSIDLFYCRKDGHGCDGEQGNFALLINASMRVSLNFDSHGNMAPPSPTGCSAGLSAQNVLSVAR
jgi:hypothetical protein